MRSFGLLLILGCLVLGTGWAAEAVPASDSQLSRAVFSTDREVAPTIEIRGTQVTVRHQVEGSGQVRGTVLRGGRTYNFAREGTYTVEPGRYQHLVYGQVPAGGAIISQVRYQ